jgi:hypothetical protein
MSYELIAYTAVGAMDGLFGAVAHGGQYIVTSPNSHCIFQPPLGGDRSIFLQCKSVVGGDR